MNYHAIFLTALSLLASHASFAQENGAARHPYTDTTHMVGIGGAFQETDAEFRATVGELPPATVDLNDLGVDEDDFSWALEYRWRFKPKWMLMALAYQFDSSGERAVQRDFNFDGKEFSAGTSLGTEVNIDTYILDVMYSVYDNGRLEVMLGGGIHALDLEASIKGRAYVGDLEREGAKASSELLAPLANFRGQFFYDFGNNLGLAASTGWLSASYDDYDGSFAYVHSRLIWAFADHWMATLGYQYMELDLTYDKSSRTELEFDVNFTGPTLFLHYRF